MVKERDDLSRDRKSNEDASQARASKNKNRYFDKRLTITDRPIRIHFDRPDRLYRAADSDREFPWKRHYTHFIPKAGKSGNGMVVECGGDRCNVCAHGNPKAFGFDRSPDDLLKKCDPNLNIGVSGWIEEDHHVVKYINDRGEDKREYFNREICEGRNCEHCRNNLPKVFGKSFYISFSIPQWDTLRDSVFDKAKRHCHCGGYLYPDAYICRKCDHPIVPEITGRCPKCGGQEISIDPEEHSAECNTCRQKWALLESSDIELKKIADTQAKCSNCGHVDYPVANLLCTGTEKNNGVCEGHPHDLYDVSMTLKKVEAGRSKVLVVDKWKIAPPDPRLFDPKRQGTGEGAEQAVLTMRAHLNLDTIFAPDTPDKQAELIGRENLFGYKPGPGAYRRYAMPTDTASPPEQDEKNS